MDSFSIIPQAGKCLELMGKALTEIYLACDAAAFETKSPPHRRKDQTQDKETFPQSINLHSNNARELLRKVATSRNLRGKTPCDHFLDDLYEHCIFKLEQLSEIIDKLSDGKKEENIAAAFQKPFSHVNEDTDTDRKWGATSACIKDFIVSTMSNDTSGEEMQETTQKSVISIDLMKFGEKVEALDEVDPDLVISIVDQIDDIILQAMGKFNTCRYYLNTGDGGILVFDDAKSAIEFAVEAEKQIILNNRSKKRSKDNRFSFRMGIATGLMTFKETENGIRMGGKVVGNAVRIEAKGAPGELLVCSTTRTSLGAEEVDGAHFDDDIETLSGKEHEKKKLHVYRACNVGVSVAGE